MNEKSAHSVPWKHLQQRLFEFVDPIYVPDGWTGLKDPGGLGVNACRALLNHWWKRQQAGEIPFEFHHWEVSPPVYEDDGVTLRTPAKMEPREDPALLPWSGRLSKPGPKERPARRTRRRKAKSTRKSAPDEDARSPSPETTQLSKGSSKVILSIYQGFCKHFLTTQLGCPRCEEDIEGWDPDRPGFSQEGQEDPCAPTRSKSDVRQRGVPFPQRKRYVLKLFDMALQLKHL